MLAFATSHDCKEKILLNTQETSTQSTETFFRISLFAHFVSGKNTKVKISLNFQLFGKCQLDIKQMLAKNPHASHVASPKAT